MLAAAFAGKRTQMLALQAALPCYNPFKTST